MRRLQLLLIVLVAGSFMLYGQNAVTIDNFDSLTPDSASVHWMAKEAKTVFTLKYDATDKVEGTGSLKVWASLDSVHQWGTYAQFGYTLNDTATPWDWAISDSVSLWIKVRTAPTLPQNMVFRISITDKPSAADPKEEYIYENNSILSTAKDWVNLKVPLFERPQNAGGTTVPDSEGFILAPTSWGGFTYNNRVLDRNKINGWTISIVTTGYTPNNIPPDSVLVSFDNFQRVGTRAVPFVVFNGKAFPPPINAGTSPWVWGNSSASVELNAGPVLHSDAIKWVQGDQWANGWTGWGCDITPATNMAGGWHKDSLKLMIKAAPGVGAMRLQFESSDNGKMGIVFTPTADSVWHSYVFALQDFIPKDVVTPATYFFDSTAVYKFNLMAEASGIAGKVVYVTNIWTGNPVIDVIPPEAPTGFQANYNSSSFYSTLSWNPVTSKPGCVYNVYYADHAWTDPLDPTVEDIPPYGLTAPTANHVLRAPGTDQSVTYYYGVIAKDQSGNVSVPALLASAPAATAKGVPTISMTPPANFVADGNIGKWTTANIKPFFLSVVTGTAHGVPNKLVANDADLSVNVYMAIDATNLYIAYDVTDDHVVADTSGVTADYMNDSPDLFIGLYDWRGKHHDGLARGTTPDYHLRFSKHRIWIDNSGVELMHRGDPNYYWNEKTLTSGYIVEAKIPLALLASKIAGDVTLFPKLGMRIPIDFAINDRDDATNPASGVDARHAIMCYSTITNDNSYLAQYWWTNTWLGNAWVTGIKQTSSDVPKVYSLAQNYPNPFNPSTQIEYSLAKPGMVSLKVYDILGRAVATLVNEQQASGSYKVTFSLGENGRSLSSGVYFYRLESGSFVSIHKMMLLK